MRPQDPTMSREALLAVFCQEIQERLGRTLKLLEQDTNDCDYEAVYE